MHTVYLTYFDKKGEYKSKGEYQTILSNLHEIWQDVKKKRDANKLPGLEDGNNVDYNIIVDVPTHKSNVQKLIQAGFNYIRLAA